MKNWLTDLKISIWGKEWVTIFSIAALGYLGSLQICTFITDWVIAVKFLLMKGDTSINRTAIYSLKKKNH